MHECVHVCACVSRTVFLFFFLPFAVTRLGHHVTSSRRRWVTSTWSARLSVKSAFFFFVPVSRLQNRTGPLCGFGLFPVSDFYFSHRNRENEITVFILETNQEAAAGTSGSSRTEPRTPNLSSGSNVTFITSVCLTRTCPAAFRLRTDRPQQAAETPTKENI